MTPDKVSIIVPAAGRSERFGTRDKLVMAWGDTTVLGAVLAEAERAGAREVITVGPELNPEGPMEASIAEGVRRAHRDAGGFLVWPGDMPLITAEAAVNVMESGDEHCAVRPRFNGIPGHPVFFGSAFREKLERLSEPARILLKEVIWLNWTDDSVIADIDTTDDYRRLRHA
ncbi:MAG: NTP transferase domain-containing protein [Rhodothermales bacterium]|nr:NTP transferase domain-containing protein [Rhodothermales bacterium]MBO6779236.1 NTP transferase domain-containing protein [Rhodothermales bacterium]